MSGISDGWLAEFKRVCRYTLKINPSPLGVFMAEKALELLAEIERLKAECDRSQAEVERLKAERDALADEKAASIGRYHWQFPCSRCGRNEYTSHAFMVDGFMLCAHCAVEEKGAR